MDELTPDTGAEFLHELASVSGLPPDEARYLRLLAESATPELVEFVLGITRQVTKSVLPSEWHPVPDSDEADRITAQPDFNLLRERATGRKSAPDGDVVHIPMEMVVHFARLWVLIETGLATPEILDGVRLIGEAERRAQASPEGDSAIRHQLTAMNAHLDDLMASEIADHNGLPDLVTTVLLFLVTDDPDEALRLDVDP
jgi:hypothetical protein